MKKDLVNFKNRYNAVSLLFKKIERNEADIYGFFIAFVVQALIESEVRKKMKEQNIEKF